MGNMQFLHDYPVARRVVALDLPLLTMYHMKYSAPDYGISRILHT